MIFANYPSLRDVVTVVTGGGSGIGASITRAFVDQGARVTILDIAQESSAALVGELAPGALHAPKFVQVDLSDIPALKGALSAIEIATGPVRVLVNNAGNDERHDLDDVSTAYWDKCVNVNLRHQFFASQAVAKGMAGAGGGAIVNLGSCSWRLGLGGMPVYLVAKAGVEGLTRALATELGPKRIRVNSIVPGFVRTPRTIRDFLTPELEAQVVAGQRLPDLVDGEHVARMALFLASADADRCTNQVYAVDGGWM